MPKLLEFKSHKLYSHSFGSPAYCFKCKKLLWGFANQGRKCAACGIVVHHKCVDTIAFECASKPHAPEPTVVDSDRIAEIFGALDIDGSGFIEMDELRNWVSTEPALQKPEMQERIKQIVEEMDSNNDGKIELKELWSFLKQLTEEEVQAITTSLFSIDSAQVQAAFNVLDGDKSGYIEKSELSKWINDEKLNVDVEALFAKLDVDGDQQVTADEFAQFFEHCPPNSLRAACRNVVVRSQANLLSQELQECKFLSGLSDHGNVFASLTLGNIYLQGLEGHDEDIAKGEDYLVKAAESGDLEPNMTAGQYFLRTDPARAAPFFKKAAEHNSAEAFYLVAACMEGNEAERFAWLEKASTAGHAAATYHLAKAYQRGQGSPQDHVKAFELFLSLKDTDANTLEGGFALLCLAQCYFQGLGTPQNLNEAYTYLLLASTKSSNNHVTATSRCFIGLLRLYGIHLARNYRMARDEFKKAKAACPEFGELCDEFTALTFRLERQMQMTGSVLQPQSGLAALTRLNALMKV